jgi:argininosuccinate synthase
MKKKSVVEDTVVQMCRLSEAEKAQLIQESQNWVRWRYKGLWWEKVIVALSQKIRELEVEIDGR